MTRFRSRIGSSEAALGAGSHCGTHAVPAPDDPQDECTFDPPPSSATGKYENGLIDIDCVPLPFVEVYQIAVNSSGRLALVLGDHGSKLALVDLDAGSVATEFGVASATHTTAGTYEVTLDVAAAGTETIVPVVTPEMNGLPDGAASARLVSVNQTGGLGRLQACIVNGNWAATDASFTFVVTGR